MKAVTIHDHHAGPEQLIYEEIPTPKYGRSNMGLRKSQRKINCKGIACRVIDALQGALPPF